MVGLNTMALVLSAVLSWHYLKGGVIVGCSGGSSCEQVLNSIWSTIGGVLPISGLALGVYFALLVAGFFIGPSTEAPIRRLAWGAMLILAGSIVGSAIWFIVLQRWVIGDFCLYCMTTHITGLLLAAFIVWRASLELNNSSKDIPSTNSETTKNNSPITRWQIKRLLPVFGKLLIGLVLAGMLAAFQVAFAPQVVYKGGESHINTAAIDYHTIPIVGSPDAPNIVTMLFDYQCPHCQKLHQMLNEAIRRFDGKLAFALFPTPLSPECNPYIPPDEDEFKNSCELAKIGLAVWTVNHEAFTTFDNWMYSSEPGSRWSPRSPKAARDKAIELVGQAKFDTAWTDPWIGKYMQMCIRLYGQTSMNGGGGVPKLIFGSRWVIPEPNNVDDLVKILQKILGVPKP